MKKIIFAIFVNFFIFTNTFWALESNYSSKEKLNEIKNWEKYIEIIDNFVDKIDNTEILEKIPKKIENIFENKKIKEKTKDFYILEYFKYKVNEKLIFFDKNLILKEKQNPTISEKDKKYAEEKIFEIQKNFLKNNLNFSEKWSLSINSNYKKENLKLEIKNFENKFSDWNIESKWNINLFSSKNNKNFFKFSSDFNLIKENFWDFYLLLENIFLDLNNENKEIEKDFKENFLKIFSDKKFINFWDLKIFENFSNYYLSENLNIFKEKNFFQAYKKENWKYFLKLNKEFCDTFYWKKCSEEKYKLFEENNNFLIYFEEKNNDFKIFFEDKKIFNEINFEGIFEKNILKNFDFKIKKYDKNIEIFYKKDWFFKLKADTWNLKWFLNIENKKIISDFDFNGWNLKVNLDLDNKFYPISGNINFDFNFWKTNINWKNYIFSGKTYFKWESENNFIKHDFDFSEKISLNNILIENNEEIWNLKSDFKIEKNNFEIFFKYDFPDFYIDFSYKSFKNFSDNINIFIPKDFVRIEDLLKNYNYNFEKILFENY